MTRKIVKRSIFFLNISASTTQTNSTTSAPNYNVNRGTNNPSFAQSQPSNAIETFFSLLF